MSTGGFTSEGCGSGNYPESLCNCLEPVLIAIQHAIEAIAYELARKSEPSCDIIGKCFDQIVSKFRDRFESAGKTCDECKQMARNGYRGTLEYAFQCAGACIEEVESVCDVNDPTTDGKPCKGCGKEPCCCYDGKCIPCPEEKEKPKHYIGWCNPRNKTVAVTRDDAPPLLPPWYQVGLGETELAAIALAEANCKQLQIITSPETGPPVQRGNFPSSACSLDLYTSQASIASFAANIDAAIQTGGWAQTADNLGDLGVGGLSLENFGQIITGVVKSVFKMPMQFTEQIVDSLSSVIDCKNSQFAPIVNLLMNIGLAQKFVGVDLNRFTTKYQYALNAICRQGYLDPDKSIAAYLAHTIDDNQLDTLWAINGICPDALQWYKQAARSKPIPLQLVNMRRRRIIDESQYQEGMRQLGYLEPVVSESLFKITEQVPTLSDLMRLMIRDADDESANGPVKQFGLDAFFDQKYGSTLREWAEFQGVPEQVARYTWRAHWTIPSPGQLFTFWHRLRKSPEYPDLKKNIDAALIQQDILPFWHKHFYAVSFNPMGRVDIRRAYNIGTLTDDEVKAAYTQLGYSDETVEHLFKFSRRLRDKSIATLPPVRRWVAFLISRQDCVNELKSDGFPIDAIDKALQTAEAGFTTSEVSKAYVRGDMPRSELLNRLTAQGCSQQGAQKIADKLSNRVRNHPALKGFAVGALSKAEARNEATTYGMNGDVADSILNAIDSETKYALLARCQNGIKQRFLAGELTRGEALSELKNRGTIDDRAEQIANEWDCEKSAIGRAIPTSTLCQLLEQGAISAVQFNKQLVNIGYTKASADLLTDNCLLAIGEKRAKLAQRQQQQLRRNELQAARAAARFAALEQRQINKLALAQKQAALARQRREKQVISAAEKLHKKCDCDLYSAIGAARIARDHVIKEYGLSIDETLAILIKAAESMGQGDLTTYADAVDAFAAEAVAIPVNGQSNGNPG